MSNLADRVKERMAAVGVGPADLARAAKVKPPSVSNWISGRTKQIKGENLLLAAAVLQCSPRWLATGMGSPAVTADEARDQTVRYIADPLIEEATELLRSLDRASRSEALQWLRGFAAGRKDGPSPGHRSNVSNNGH